MLGWYAKERPSLLINIPGEFVNNGMVLMQKILLTLLAKARIKRSQIVKANIVNKARYLAMIRTLEHCQITSKTLLYSPVSSRLLYHLIVVPCLRCDLVTSTPWHCRLPKMCMVRGDAILCPGFNTLSLAG